MDRGLERALLAIGSLTREASFPRARWDYRGLRKDCGSMLRVRGREAVSGDCVIGRYP